MFNWLFLLSIAAAIISGADETCNADPHAFQNETVDYEYASIPVFPGIAWNMSQEEVMEALDLSEEDVIDNDYGFTVEELPCYKTTAKVNFFFSTFIGTEQGLSEIFIGFPDDANMEAIEAILTESYGNPDPVTQQIHMYSQSQNMYREEQPEEIVLRSGTWETDEHLKVWLGAYKNLNDYLSVEELAQLRGINYKFANCSDEMWEEFTAKEAPAQAYLSDLGFDYQNGENNEYVQEAKVLRLIGWYAAAADAVREWNQQVEESGVGGRTDLSRVIQFAGETYYYVRDIAGIRRNELEEFEWLGEIKKVSLADEPSEDDHMGFEADSCQIYRYSDSEILAYWPATEENAREENAGMLYVWRGRRCIFRKETTAEIRDSMDSGCLIELEP